MTEKDLKSLAQELRELLKHIPKDPPATLDERRRAKVRDVLDGIASDVSARIRAYDPVRQPGSFFDPSDPLLFGTFVALALTAGQEREPLAQMASNRFYGSGVYALYYKGKSAYYKPISKTEHPIYVGAADPQESQARSPREQGSRLWRRLEDHRKNISRPSNLDIDDFECRFLAVQSGWQVSAESALIALFRPVWNKEMKVLQGFGKHGDAAETRKNKRSPWDTLHPGRAWAGNEKLEDKKKLELIEEHVKEHFEKTPTLKTQDDIFAKLIAAMNPDRHVPLP